MVGGALALSLDEDGGVNDVLAVPGGEAVAVSERILIIINNCKIILTA